MKPGSAYRRPTLTIRSSCEEDTRAFGRRLGELVRRGDLIGLRGELGSGKTCLVRGLAEGMGISGQRVRSPSFTLINEYGGGRLPLYHIDLYRLQPSNVDRIALREYLYGDGVCVVEWFERLGEEAAHLEIGFTFVGESERLLVVSAAGERYDGILIRLQE